MPLKQNCDMRVFQARNRAYAFMTIITVIVALIFPILIWTDVIPFVIDNTEECTDSTIYQNNTRNVYECRSNVTLFVPAWYDVVGRDEGDNEWLFIPGDDPIQYHNFKIDYIILRISSLNYDFANTYFSFTDESQADAYLSQCADNKVLIGYEEIDLYLRNPRFFDTGDICIKDNVNETFQMPIGKASFMVQVIVKYRTQSFSNTDTLYTTVQASNKTNPLNLWNCANRNVTFNYFKFNDAGQYLDEVRTVVSSSDFAAETLVWNHA